MHMFTALSTFVHCCCVCSIASLVDSTHRHHATVAACSVAAHDDSTQHHRATVAVYDLLLHAVIAQQNHATVSVSALCLHMLIAHSTILQLLQFLFFCYTGQPLGAVGFGVGACWGHFTATGCAVAGRLCDWTTRPQQNTTRSCCCGKGYCGRWVSTLVLTSLWQLATVEHNRMLLLTWGLLWQRMDGQWGKLCRFSSAKWSQKSGYQSVFNLLLKNDIS